MHSVLLIIFALSTLLILHTYVLYPLLMLLFRQPRRRVNEFSAGDELPQLAILVAAYNEEKVIGEKIRSVYNSHYPLSKIRLCIGSDASTDNTDQVVQSLAKEFPNLELVKFPGRVGKINIINELRSRVTEELLVLTDANVIFTPTTLIELVKPFKDKRVGLVAANIIKESHNNDGISYQEKTYLSLENKIKAGESNAFNLLMGAEGGCYALRNQLFTQVPGHFIVDDFFITLSVLDKQKFALFNSKALCIEDVDSDTYGEYRRKVRISSGNFQNLFYFKKNLLQFWKPLCFAFWSHKVLRWLTPFLLILALLASAVLAGHSQLFTVLFILQLLGLLMPVFNHFFKFSNAALKFASHFYLMNFALLDGCFKFAKGIKSSIWQPVKRNV